MRWILGITTLALVALGIALARDAAPSIEIRNSSGIALRGVLVSVGDEKAQIQASPAGTDGRHFLPLSAPARAEGPLRVTLLLPDGSRRVLEAGWVSPSMVGGAVITVVSADSVHFSTR